MQIEINVSIRLLLLSNMVYIASHHFNFKRRVSYKTIHVFIYGFISVRRILTLTMIKILRFFGILGSLFGLQIIN